MIQSSCRHYCKTNLVGSVVCRLFHSIPYTLHRPILFSLKHILASIDLMLVFPGRGYHTLSPVVGPTSHNNRYFDFFHSIRPRFWVVHVRRWTHCDRWPIPEVCSVSSLRRYPLNSALCRNKRVGASTLSITVRYVRFGPRGKGLRRHMTVPRGWTVPLKSKIIIKKKKYNK